MIKYSTDFTRYISGAKSYKLYNPYYIIVLFTVRKVLNSIYQIMMPNNGGLISTTETDILKKQLKYFPQALI